MKLPDDYPEIRRVYLTVLQYCRAWGLTPGDAEAEAQHFIVEVVKLVENDPDGRSLECWVIGLLESGGKNKPQRKK